MTGEAVLRAIDIRKTFGEGETATEVLKGINLEFGKSEFIALMGPSGSGKSTLLTILGTLLQPTSGVVEIVGRATNELSEAELTEFRNQHIGFVFQFHHLLPDFTAHENVMFPAFAKNGGATPAARERAAQLIERVGLSNRINYRATKLSGGQKQRIAIARGVMMQPDIVFADEPTGNLDRENSREVMKLLRELSQAENTTFIISTHDAEIAEACDRTINIVDGKISNEKPDSGEK